MNFGCCLVRDYGITYELLISNTTFRCFSYARKEKRFEKQSINFALSASNPLS